MISNSVLQRALSLLAEVRDICDDNNISYFIAPKLLIRSLIYEDLMDHFVLPGVLMNIDDFQRFIGIVEADRTKGRAIDYMGNNRNFPGFFANYVDENSTYIRINRGPGIAGQGIRVVIDVIRDSTKSKYAGVLETGWEYNGFLPPINDTRKKEIAGQTVRVLNGARGENAGRKMFSYLCNAYGNDPNSKEVIVRLYRTPKVMLSRKVFDRSDTIDLGGHTFKIPSNVNEYLTAFYGPDWKNNDFRIYNSRQILTAHNVPYAEYIERLEKCGCSLNSLFDSYAEKTRNNRDNQEILNSRNQTFQIAKRSGDRLRVYRDLHQKIEHIRELYNSKNYEELNDLFSEYHDLTMEYYHYGLALCPDEELFNIECELLIHAGKKEMADNLRQLVPEQHKKPLIEIK